MKLVVVAAALLLPAPVMAETLDVIESRLKDGCTASTYLAITKDFNALWGKSNGYNARIAMPVHSKSSASIIWMGTTASAEIFGKAWDTWRNALSDPNSVPAKLQARFDACSTQISRSSYDVY